MSDLVFDYAEIDNIKFEAIDHKDYPDFCDACIVEADYKGVPMTDEEIELINEDRQFVYDRLIAYLF